MFVCTQTNKNYIHLLMKGPSHCKHGELRRQSTNGILEFCDRGMWSVICGDFWTDSIASVVCQQMNYASEGTNSF